ncbi:alpha/beta hydrolase [Daejeonella sp.]|uniref:alpha/beta hydrolase n=1 Tax=Daejeonella sp. TaxID=2805397 RepID=UPI0030BCB070
MTIICLSKISNAQSPQQIQERIDISGDKFTELVYKKIDTLNLKLRVYYPSGDDGRKIYPAIVLFFGGGWVNGSITQFEQQARYLNTRGMAAVLVDYRVTNRNKSTPFESVKDAKTAIRYVRSNSSKLRIYPDKIAAGGGSAGAQMAAAADLTALDEASESLTVSSRPNALVLFNPVFDNGPNGYGFERIGERYNEISPLHNIRKGAAPTLVLLGTSDKLVPVATAQLYQSKMQKAGSRCDLILYQDQPHGFFNIRPKLDKKYFYETLKEADIFLASLGYIKKFEK